MAAELLINGKDAYLTWGVRMDDNFLDALGVAVPLKEFIENKCRTEHGKRVIVSSPKLDERDLILAFTIEGSTPSEYRRNKNSFYQELYKGKIDIQVPANGNEVYHLVYLGKSVSYAQSIDRTFGKISSKFEEPNPSMRD